MIRSDGFIVQDVGGASVGGDYRIRAAIIIYVTNRHATPYPRLPEDISGSGRDIDELASIIAQQHHRLAIAQLRIDPLNRIHIVPLCDHQIFPSIIVIIKETHTPAGVQERNVGQIRGTGCVVEGAVPVVW